MVEGASIDKMEHPLDWQRAVYDTIEMDKAIGIARRWAEQHGNETLIVVTADHNHSMSVIGTNTRSINAGRQGNGVYADAGFPDFRDADGDGFPDDPDPNRTLFIRLSDHPDYYDDFRLDPQPLSPANDASGSAEWGQCGPQRGEGRRGGFTDRQLAAGTLDNTEVFSAIIDALGIDARTSQNSPVNDAAARRGTLGDQRRAGAAGDERSCSWAFAASVRPVGGDTSRATHPSERVRLRWACEPVHRTGTNPRRGCRGRH